MEEITKKAPKKNTVESQILVIFGSNGDLSKRKLLPAIFQLYLDDLLPDNFQRKEAIELALNKLQIKERTADGYLSKLLANKLLDNPRSGQYEKIKKWK